MNTLLTGQWILRIMVGVIFFICFAIPSTGQTQSPIKEFEITVSSFNFPVRPFGSVIIRNDKLVIIKEIGPDEEKGIILFEAKLNPTDTLKIISEINLAKLKNIYFYNCVDDGSQINVIIKKGKITKAVQLDNYYQEDIGTIIYFINSIVPNKYKIWYDKEMLVADYKNCNSNK